MKIQIVKWLARPALFCAIVGILLSTAKATTFTNTGGMTYGRGFHTATLLLDGSVLVAGGLAGGVLQSAELYNPATGTWTVTGTMDTARYMFTATLLTNGMVLVAGGANVAAGPLANAELYDPATRTWSPTEPMHIARYAPTATLLPDGRVLVSGGANTSVISSAELYDPATRKWTTTGSMNSSRVYFKAIALANGKVLAMGGEVNDQSLSTAELYDPAVGTWTPTGTMDSAREQFPALLLSNGKVLVAGGIKVVGGAAVYLSAAELYDPVTEKWTVTGAMSTGRGRPTATRLPNDTILATGGIGAGGSFLQTAELYDPATETWSLTGTMNTARDVHTATLLANGKVLVAGAYGGVGSAELYDSAYLFRIVNQPRSQTGYWGRSVTFSVAVTNAEPPVTYQWHKDSTPLVDATTATLVLTNLQSTNAGTYTVVVTDAVTNLTSLPATLTVNPAGVGIALYAGVSIDGVVGQTYGVQATTNLSDAASWAGMTNITLNVTRQIWYDYEPASEAQRYYRVVAGPISIP